MSFHCEPRQPSGTANGLGVWMGCPEEKKKDPASDVDNESDDELFFTGSGCCDHEDKKEEPFKPKFWFEYPEQTLPGIMPPFPGPKINSDEYYDALDRQLKERKQQPVVPNKFDVDPDD